MTQVYDSLTAKLDAALVEFEAKGGKADTIILPPVDMGVLVNSPHLQFLATSRRPIQHYRGVRVMEGQPFDHGYVEGHDYRSQPSRIRV